MKKYVIGFAVGASVTLGTAAYASDIVQTFLFPAQFVINGESRTPAPDYAVLNYNGHAYVPIRFVAEQLGAVVAYDDASQTITVDNRFAVRDMESSIRVGQLQVNRQGQQTKVTGQLFVGQSHWDMMANARNWVPDLKETEVTARLYFYNERGERIGEVALEQQFATHGDQIKPFEAIADGDLTSYAAVTLSVISPIPFGLMAPPTLNYTDADKRLAVGSLKLAAEGDFTQIKAWASLKVDGRYRVSANLDFYDADGKLLGTAPMSAEMHGMDPAKGNGASAYELMCKGDVSAYSDIRITDLKLEPLED